MKVLYIAGWGRSGTTILDNILGCVDGFFSVGEISYLWKRGLLKDGRCGCGELVVDCALWQEVLKQPFEDGVIGDVDPRLVVEWQDSIARVRHTWRILSGRGARTDAVTRYPALLAATYAAVGRVTGARVVIDSSKRPSNAALLTTMSGVEPYVLQMVRDPRAVTYSWQRKKLQPGFAKTGYMLKHSAWDSTTSWLAWNMASAKLRRRVGSARSMLLRYEDFVARPQTVTRSILEMLDEDPANLPFEDERTVHLHPNHTVSGNPSRFKSGSVELRTDDEWKSAQPKADRLVTTAVAAPLLRHYGYTFRVPERDAAGRAKQHVAA